MLLETLVRVLADGVAVNLALVAALIIRFLWLVNNLSASATDYKYQELLNESLRAYQSSTLLLTVLCLVVFYLSGFYTYGRAYRSRYKALLIIQAVSVSYLLFGFLTYLLASSFSPFTPEMPRSALLGGWILTLFAVGGMRVLSTFWRRVAWAEAKILGVPKVNTVKNVTVIGGAGYIGSVLVRKLLDKGYSVTVLDALLYGDESIRDLYDHSEFELIEDDLRNVEAVVRALQHAHAVVDLAALVGDPACELDEKLTVEINLAATRMIAAAAKGYGVERFIFASTCSVYGASAQVLDEFSELRPVSLYARTKIGSEEMLLSLEGDRFAPTILRFGTAYGMSHRPRFDLVVNLFSAQAATQKEITILGGEQWRPFIHVEDAADAIIHVMEVPLGLVAGQVFNVGSDDQNLRIRELGEIIQTHIPEVKINQHDEDIDRRDYRVSFSKFREQLDFTTKRTIIDGILEIKNAIDDGRIQDYHEARYSNYKTLSDENHTQLIHETHLTPLYTVTPDDET
jgi:nucleoside-diphosphate-sugar epimerase